MSFRNFRGILGLERMRRLRRWVVSKRTWGHYVRDLPSRHVPQRKRIGGIYDVYELRRRQPLGHRVGHVLKLRLGGLRGIFRSH